MADRKTERRLTRAYRELTRRSPDPDSVAEDGRRYPPATLVASNALPAAVVEDSGDGPRRLWSDVIVRAFTLPSAASMQTRDSATMAAQAKVLNRGVAEQALYGQSKEMRLTRDFLEAMADRVWVYACVTRKAKSMKEGKLVIEPNAGVDPQPLAKHGLLDLFKSPNPMTAYGLFMEQMQMDLDLAGNFYAEVVYGTGNAGVPLQLWRMSPDRMRILVDKTTGDIDGYLYVPGGPETAVRLEPWQVWHRRYANPLDDYRGLSPLSAARDSIIFEYQAKAQGIAFFANGLRMSGLISGPDNVAPDDLTLMRRVAEGRHRGSTNAHKVLILPGQWSYTDMSATPRDADWIEGLAMTRREVCAIYRVAPPLAGDFSEGTTFSNMEQARDEFWQGTMSEHFSNLDEDINHSLLPRFGNDSLRLIARHDLSEVRSMQDDLDAAYTRNLAAFNGGLITLNEARKGTDDATLLPLEDAGDVRRIGIAIQEIPGDEPPIEPEAPPVEKGPNDDDPNSGGAGNGETPTPEKGDPQSGKDGKGKANAPRPQWRSVKSDAASYAVARAKLCAPVIVSSTNAVRKFMADQQKDFFAFMDEHLQATGEMAGASPVALRGLEGDLAGPVEALPSIVKSYEWNKPERLFAERISKGIHLLASKPAWDYSNQIGLGVSYNLNDPDLIATLNRLQEQYNGPEQGVFAQLQDELIDEVAKGLDYGADLHKIINGGTITPLTGPLEPDGLPPAPVELKGLKGVYKPWAEKGQEWKAERFARTETGKAYNMSSVDSYRAAGISQVDVYDGEYDPPCAEANGQVWSIDFAYDNPLEHPNCVRAFGPHMED